MSYSLPTVRGDTLEELLAALATSFERNALASQPIHELDREAHFEHIKRQFALLPPLRPGYEYTASMSGYLSWDRLDASGAVTKDAIVGTGFGCSVGMRRKEA